MILTRGGVLQLQVLIFPVLISINNWVKWLVYYIAIVCVCAFCCYSFWETNKRLKMCHHHLSLYLCIWNFVVNPNEYISIVTRCCWICGIWTINKATETTVTILRNESRNLYAPVVGADSRLHLPALWAQKSTVMSKESGHTRPGFRCCFCCGCCFCYRRCCCCCCWFSTAHRHIHANMHTISFFHPTLTNSFLAVLLHPSSIVWKSHTNNSYLINTINVQKKTAILATGALSINSTALSSSFFTSIWPTSTHTHEKCRRRPVCWMSTRDVSDIKNRGIEYILILQRLDYR